MSVSRRLGYGTYAFVVREVSHLEPAAVFSIFTWDGPAADQNHRELDIEISRWGDPGGKNAQYVVQPYYVPANVATFKAPAGVLTYSLRWEPGRATFRTVRGAGSGAVVSEHATRPTARPPCASSSKRAPRPLRPVVRDEVYRIGREALVNALRHARATRIEVELAYGARALRVLVRDNGSGIDPEVLRSGRDGIRALGDARAGGDDGGRLKVGIDAGAGPRSSSVRCSLAFVSGPSAGPFGWLRSLYSRQEAARPEGSRGGAHPVKLHPARDGVSCSPGEPGDSPQNGGLMTVPAPIRFFAMERPSPVAGGITTLVNSQPDMTLPYLAFSTGSTHTFERRAVQMSKMKRIFSRELTIILITVLLIPTTIAASSLCHHYRLWDAVGCKHLLYRRHRRQCPFQCC